MRLRSAAVVLLVGAVAVSLAVASPASAAKGSSFANFEVAATPPSPAGTLCPGDSLCWNTAAEPAIRSAPDGKFFASSENGIGLGTLAWASFDKGLHYASTSSPNDISVASTSTGKEAGL